MINLPISTEYNKRIPKQKLYENLAITPSLKKIFVNNIKVIYWRNKISSSTMNLAQGKNVTEIEVFEVRLYTPTLDEAILQQIDKYIPYHILFLLKYGSKYQAWIGYKESTTETYSFKISEYYHTDWVGESDLSLTVEGLNLDAVYENFVRQIAGDILQSTGKEESLQEAVRRNEQKVQLEKQIVILKAKIRKEPQLNKQMELNAEIKKLKKQLEQNNN